MKLIRQKIEDYISKIQKYFAFNNKVESKEKNRRKQLLNIIIIILAGLIGILVLLLFLTSNKKNKELGFNTKVKNTVSNEKIELGTEATSGDVKWQNFLEESIEAEGQKRQEQIEVLKDAIAKTSDRQQEEANNELNQLKISLSYALAEIERLKTEHQNIQNDIASLAPEDEEKQSATLDITVISEETIKTPVSSFNHIPATSYVSGNLLGGIVVSTSVNSASEPIPVIIKLIDRGNLPAKFAVDIEQCRLLASCYGDISSERAIIRAEELVCEDKKSGLITSTKVSGVIYGDDGANGIRGTVVSMSDKHLKNAFIGGILSGFSNTVKGQAKFDVMPFGAVSTKRRGVDDMAKEGLIGGGSSAAEKLSDYYIKLAENISPVILVPGGTKVDIVFTKSVAIGSFDIEEVIQSERDK